MNVATAFPLDAEAVIPHRLPLRLIDRLVEADEGGAVIEVFPRPGHLFAEPDGRLHEVALLEMMAQSFAAMRGNLASLSDEPVRVGYLVGVRGFRAHLPAYATEALSVVVRAAGSVDTFHMADAEVYRAGDRIAQASIRVWTPEPEAPSESGTAGTAKE
jgi:predicted hotdog family 3-hydroxylacyl-ACP dehydratase